MSLYFKIPCWVFLAAAFFSFYHLLQLYRLPPIRNSTKESHQLQVKSYLLSPPSIFPLQVEAIPVFEDVVIVGDEDYDSNTPFAILLLFKGTVMIRILRIYFI